MIAALYVLPGGPYFSNGFDPWDETRDARKFKGPGPVIAHPRAEGGEGTGAAVPCYMVPRIKKHLVMTMDALPMPFGLLEPLAAFWSIQKQVTPSLSMALRFQSRRADGVIPTNTAGGRVALPKETMGTELAN